MSILDRIIANKVKEVGLLKEKLPIDLLEKSDYLEKEAVSLSVSLAEDNSSCIIAEFKRRSPSAGIVNEKVEPEVVARDYELGGAAGISVLTDGKYFGGSLDDLGRVRKAVKLPLLRKEFIIDEYQVIESRAEGADAILLIAAALDKGKVKILSELARDVGLEVVLEVHSEEELDHLHPAVNIVGVNNRDLKRMVTDVGISRNLAVKIPEGFLRISESGISNATAIVELRDLGYRGFLIGEYFMKQEDPGAACSELIQSY